MRFDASLRERWRQTDGGWSIDLPEGWMQGRSVFGGLTAAAAAALARRQVDAERQLRTLSVSLVRPTAAGRTEGRCRILREGKSTSFVESRLLQGGEETATVSLLFAKPRAGSMRLPTPRWTSTVDPEPLEELPYLPGLTPEFLQHVSMRWVTGGFPFSGQTEPRLSGYAKFKIPAGDVEGIIGLLDFWPLPALSMLQSPVPASTVTWTAHILEVPTAFDGWFGFEYDTIAGQDGFHTIAGRLFAPDGRLVAWTEQLAALFD